MAKFLLDWMPETVSTFGPNINSIILLIFIIIIPWFVLTEGVLIYFVLRYRRKSDVRAVYEPGTTLRSLAWVLVPGALVFVFDIAIDLHGSKVWHLVKQELPENSMTVRVIASQFNWKFIHAGTDLALDTTDDITTDHILHVPIHQPIVVELTSTDVIHSFFVPTLRLKQDVVPGRRILGWFEATQEGTYEIACAELCGLGHTKMRGWLQVHGKEDFQQWEQQAVQQKSEEVW